MSVLCTSLPRPLLQVALLSALCAAALGCDDADGVATSDADVTDGHVDDRCEASTDCTLSAAGCCSACGQPTISDVEALTSSQLQARQVRCEGEICGACGSLANPHLQPVCAQAQCTVFDSTGDPVRDCTVDADCEVRTPDCCGCGSFADPYAMIAIHRDRHDDYVAGRCPEFATLACEPCDPTFPGDVVAACEQGQCVIVLPFP